MSSSSIASPFHVTYVRSSSTFAKPHARARDSHRTSATAVEGPSCLFVGPVDSASKEKLEALYQQARYSYYNGRPLIVDDMFDKVELKLRLYGSKSVVKYPRCSLRRQSTYSDAEEDPSQVVALASIWMLLLLFGSIAVTTPIFISIGHAFQDAIDSGYFSRGKQLFDMLTTLNASLFVGLGCFIGYPIASASVQALRGLWRNNLVALKGSCPNCGEEVFAFVRAEKSNLRSHCTECHVCESSLEFRPKVEQSTSKPGERWIYGRIYLISRSNANI